MAATLAVIASAATEGASVVISMLITALVFLAVIAIGDLSHRYALKRESKKTPTL